MANCFGRKRLLLSAAIGLLILVSSLARARDHALSLSLSDALKMAQERHADVIVANERIQQAIAQLKEARSTLLPQVTGAVSETRQTKNLAAMGINIPGRDPLVGPFNAFDARIALVQNVFDAQAIERLRTATVARQISEAASQKTEQDVLALVAALYIDARRAAELEKVAQALLLWEGEKKRISSERHGLGMGSSFEVIQRDSDVAKAHQSVEAARAMAMEKRRDLAAAIGIDPEQAIAFRETATGRRGVPGVDDVEAALRRHPDRALAEQTVRLRKTERSVEKAAFFPKVTASADYGASGESPGDSKGTYTLGARLTVPLFEGGLRKYRIDEAKSRVREGEVRQSEVDRETEAKALSARDRLASTAADLRAAEAKLAEASMQISLARQRRESGLGSELELTDARAAEVAARDQRNQAWATWQLADVGLFHAMGRMESLAGSREDLKEP